MASSYLMRRLRGLKEACGDYWKKKGETPPCAICGIGDLCLRCEGDAAVGKSVSSNLDGQFSSDCIKRSEQILANAYRRSA